MTEGVCQGGSVLRPPGRTLSGEGPVTGPDGNQPATGKMSRRRFLLSASRFCRIYELSMVNRVSAVLYGKPRAVVQAFQAQSTFLFDPDRMTVPALYGMLRTLAGT